MPDCTVVLIEAQHGDVYVCSKLTPDMTLGLMQADSKRVAAI